jgi:hypothetical protein
MIAEQLQFRPKVVVFKLGNQKQNNEVGIDYSHVLCGMSGIGQSG